MKVKIGPYLTYWGPYQLVDLFLFWKDEDQRHEISKKLADTKLATICEKIYSWRKRTIKIRIDPYDTWNMDSTLALIVLPMLKKLRAEKHGTPYVEDADVPENLRYKLTGSFQIFRNFDQGELFPLDSDDHESMLSDDMFAARWDYVLGEMIWAFEQLQPDNDWEEQYDKTRDWNGRKTHQERIDNGVRLFGTYYQALWD